VAESQSQAKTNVPGRTSRHRQQSAQMIRMMRSVVWSMTSSMETLLREAPASHCRGLRSYLGSAGGTGDPHLNGWGPSPLIIAHDQCSGLSRIAHPCQLSTAK
jgi:hypothetical protein